MSNTNVAVTGCGWVTPGGAGRFDALLRQWQAHGLGDLSAPLLASADPGEQAAADVGPHGGPGTRLAALTLAATRIALEQSGLDAGASRDRVGLHLGTAFSGQTGMIAFGREIVRSGARFVSPLVFPETVGNFAASTVARLLDVRGPNQTICAGADSGLAAIIEAMRQLRAGAADAMIVGGADVLTDELAEALLRRRDGEPLAASLSGARLCEGACAFVLENAASAARRGSVILGVVERRNGDGKDPCRAGMAIVRGDGTKTRRDVGRRQAAAMLGQTPLGIVWTDALWGDGFAHAGAAALGLSVSALHGSALPLASAESTDDARPPWIRPPGPVEAVYVLGGEGVPAMIVRRAAAGA